MQVMDKELLEKQLNLLLEKEGSGCRALLQQDRADDLQRMFSLLQRIPDGLDPMADIFKRHILDVGQACIDQRLSAAASSSSASAGAEGKESSAESRENEDAQLVKDLVGVHEKYQTLLQMQFSHHNLFQKALKDAFTELLNKDDLGGNNNTSNTKYKAADLLAGFCDRLLRKNTAEKLAEAEVEHWLEQTVRLFLYIADKDFFAEVYRHQLAKRLLHQRSASDDMERMMIGKLKARCGAQFTGKVRSSCCCVMCDRVRCYGYLYMYVDGRHDERFGDRRGAGDCLGTFLQRKSFFAGLEDRIDCANPHHR
jgi:cullin 1